MINRSEGENMLKNLHKTPWPWFGGKADAAPLVWSALGDVAHYVEPFAGSLAVLLRRPHPCNRTYYSETVNDLDGLLCNAWRSMVHSPEAMARAASWPVCEADLMARHLALLDWRGSRSLERLMADPEWHDPKMAGWWAWGQSCWIGSGWCSGRGAWIVGEDGRIHKQPRQAKRAPGASRKLPHLADDGKGVNHANARAPGVDRQRPHLTDNGKGVNHANARAPGVDRWHPMTMPELRRWFRFLSARLRHVRILNGDWRRACKGGALRTLPVRSGKGKCGVFLDPPYLVTGNRDRDLYVHDDGDTVAADVREWCIDNGDAPDLRIVLAGFDGEHDVLSDRHGWRCVPWFRSGFLKGGMSNVAGSGAHQQTRERLWISPHCVPSADERQQIGLFSSSRG